MQSTAAVDDLILWHGAGILALVWLIVAAASLNGFLTKADYASPAKPSACIVEYGCDPLMRASWQLNRS
jgi:hypothetical protein